MSRKKADKSVYECFGRQMSKMVDNQEYFAGKVKVSSETVRVWCLGKSLPDIRQLILISSELDVTMEWLLTGKTPKSGQGSLFSAEALSRYGFLEKIVAEVNEAARIGLSEETAVGNLIDEMRKVRRSLQDIKKTAESGKAE